MPGGWLWVVGAFALADLLLVVLVVRGTVGQIFGTLSDRYPARPPEEPSVSRRFQSFRFGLVNLGLSVHVAADGEYLHLTPVRPLRWIGVRKTSVPWDAVQLGKRRGVYRKARIGAADLVGPAWALDMADPDTGGDGGDTL